MSHKNAIKPKNSSFRGHFAPLAPSAFGALRGHCQKLLKWQFLTFWNQPKCKILTFSHCQLVGFNTPDCQSQFHAKIQIFLHCVHCGLTLEQVNTTIAASCYPLPRWNMVKIVASEANQTREGGCTRHQATMPQWFDEKFQKFKIVEFLSCKNSEPIWVQSSVTKTVF